MSEGCNDAVMYEVMDYLEEVSRKMHASYKKLD